jgi:hypothetical protein
MIVFPVTFGLQLASHDGGVFAFGNARFFGSLGGTRLNEPVTDIQATPDGQGYWLVAADGGVFAFGNAKFYGSMAATPPPNQVFHMAATATGAGYRFVAADGSVYAFGDAQFYGSLPMQQLSRAGGVFTNPSPITAIAGS